MILQNLFFISCALFFVVDMSSQNSIPPVEAILEIVQSKNNGKLEIVPVAKNLTQHNHKLRYELSVVTSSYNRNSSSNSQSGGFKLNPSESKDLSQTTISTGAQSKTIIELILYDQNDRVIDTAKEILDLAEEEENKKN